MTPPTTIKEEGTRWTIENARPLGMRILIGAATPIILAAVGFTMYGDVYGHRWVMLAIRSLFALLVLVSARFALFGSEALAVVGDELVWTRGNSEERCQVGDVDKLEHTGTQLWVHVRGVEHPFIVGAGLRQPPAAMAWLSARVEQAITAARTGTRPR
jgi:hypothetical protein